MTGRALFVPGVPVQQGSKQPGPGMRETTGARLDAWRTAIAWRVKAAGWHREPLTGPVHLTARFVMPRLTSHRDRYWSVSTPDLDKLLRALGDALTTSGAYRDDRQIAQITASKVHGHTTGVHITLTEITAPQ